VDDAELGSVGSWVRDGALGAALLAGEFLVVAIFVDHGPQTGNAVQMLTEPDNVLYGLAIGLIGALSGALVALVAWPAARAFYRVHPGLAFLGGPPTGFAVTAVTVVGSVALLDESPQLSGIAWGRVGMLGAGIGTLAWPVYLVLRHRGRSGWPAWFVASGCMVLPIVVMAWL